MNLERIETTHGVLLAVATGVALLTGWLQVGSLLLGGLAMSANFWLLKGLVRRVLRPGKGAGWALALLTAKLGLFLALLALVFWRVPVDGLSFALGVTLLLAACVIEALRASSPPATSEGTI